MADIATISPLSLKTLYDREQGIHVFDVRTPAEFQELRLPFSKLAPLEALKPREVVEQAGIGDTETIYLSCSRMAAEKFLKEGFGNVCVVEGGVEGWASAGLPVLRGRKVISLERQVRIAAGSLVVLGLTLGYAVHPGFAGLSAFVGCGLVFAGITDTCGMGMLLARMPWNQAGTEPPKACSQ
jgi:rhodanese-related sulfurtransferase